MLKISLLLSCLFLFSCAAFNYSNFKDLDGAKQTTLTSSLLSGDEFSEAAIQKVLSSQVKIQKPVRIAVVRVENKNYQRDFYSRYKKSDVEGYDFEEKQIEAFYKKIRSDKNVSSFKILPKTLISVEPTYKKLRTAAVLVQADLLLVLDTDTYSNWDVRFVKPNVAKGVTNMEAFILDTRTGLVVASGVYADTTEVNFKNSDYDNDEAMKRARIESENKVLALVADDVIAFLNKK